MLDVGCGPGTITADLAEAVTPGRVVGLDAAPGVLSEARSAADDRTPVAFVAGDVLRLPFGDASFDVVHAHQVLQHLDRPIEALREMRRVCRPGGTVAVRDGDYRQMAWFPEDERIDRAFDAYRAVTRLNRANWDAGRRLLSWARTAGFGAVTPSASVWCFATPDERAWWGELWAERFTRSALADQLVAGHLADRDDLAGFGTAFRQWAAADDGWYSIVHGEVLASP